MANYPEDLHYTKDHEWLRLSGSTGTIGITEFASEALGDVVFVELPEVGEHVTSGKPFGSVESVKSVNELFAPVTGEVSEVNDALTDAPELVNNSPFEDGWMIRVKLEDRTEVDALLTASEYEDFVAEQKAT